MRFLLSSILLILLSQAPVALARTAYNCASPARSGTFELTDDCTLNGEVSLTGDLDILGVPKADGSYPVITAASSSRHFGITSGAHKLTLKYLKMVDGNAGSSYGGSIFVYEAAGTLDISHCVFFNCRSDWYGGAIYAYKSSGGTPNLFFSFVRFTENYAKHLGGAVMIKKATLVDHSSTYNMNTVGVEGGGALCLSFGSHSSFFNSSLVSNTAGWKGGGIYAKGSGSPSYQPHVSSLYMSSVTLQSNTQTNTGSGWSGGGGGLYLETVDTVNIRESTFIENEARHEDRHGHQIFTSPSSTSLTIVNTQFTHITGDNAFYGPASPTTCASSNPCTVAPFTGTCADLGNEGTTCDYETTYRDDYDCVDDAKRSLLPLPPPVIPCCDGYIAEGGVCTPHTTCGDQTDTTPRLLTGASATAAGTCADCAADTYAPDEASTCLPYTTCGNQVDGTTTRLTGASSTTAGTCVACDSGTYAPDEASTCLDQTTCGNQVDGTTTRLTGASSTTAGTCADCAADTYAPDVLSTCLPHTTCGNQTDTTTRLTGSSSTAAGTCVACDSGSFAPDEASNCQLLTVCNAETQYESSAPDATTDRKCKCLANNKVVDNESACTTSENEVSILDDYHDVPEHRPVDIKFADANGDGHQDAFVAYYKTDKVTVYLMDTDGQILSTLNIAKAKPLEIAVSHFDGDTHVDLLILDENGKIDLHKGDGTGSFEATGTQIYSGADKNLHIVDIDDDGDMDVLFRRDTKITLERNNGDGTFGNSVDVTSGAGGAFGNYHPTMTTADFNNDGHIDVGICDYHSSSIYSSYNGAAIYINDGSSDSFTTVIVDNFQQCNGKVASGDFDGDGKVEMLYSHQTNGLTIIEHSSGNTFTATTLNADITAKVYGGAGKLIVTDYDGDNSVDVVAKIVDEPGLTLLSNNGNGSSFTRSMIASSGVSFDKAILVDFDGTGNPDLFYTSLSDIVKGIISSRSCEKGCGACSEDTTRIAGDDPFLGYTECCSGGYQTEAQATCLDHTTCGNQVDGTTRLTGASATTAGTCAACADGSHAPDGATTCELDKCISPDTTNYAVTETDLKIASFNVSATCTVGGTATVAKCTANGEAYVLSGCRPAYNCASPATTGEFALAEDCQLNGEVSLSGDLDILGVPKGDGSYPVITAASNTRHFSITSGAHKLTLKYLKMVDGNTGNLNGGSIYVKSVAATLNVSDSVFFNNRATYGGAIYAEDGDPNLFLSRVSFTENNGEEGGAVYILSIGEGNLVDHSCTYTANTASFVGGGIYMMSGSISLFGSSFINNTAAARGGGIFTTGYTSDPSFLNMESVTLQSNKQIGPYATLGDGGGGLVLSVAVTANIRESTFIENEAATGWGHQIFTREWNGAVPSLTIVNTEFTNIVGDHAFSGPASTTTCSADPCTVAPFTGTCTDLGNEGAQCACADADVYAPLGTSTCLAHTTCGDQTDATTRLTDASATAAGTCADCDSGSFAPDAETSCQTHFDTSVCAGNDQRAVEGTATTDSVCADLCGATKYESGVQCIDYITTCPSGSELSPALSDAQRTCDACPIGEYKTLNDGSACLPCQDAYEVIPINATEGATDCVACNVSTEYDHDNLAHTGCIATTDKCDKNFQFVVTAGNAPNLCEACSPGTEQLADATTAQCKACVEGQFSSNGHACALYTDIETQCYEQRKKFIKGTVTVDAHCGDACPAGQRPKGTVCAYAVCANEPITIKRTSNQHPLRLVSEADCEGNGCKAGTWTTRPDSTVPGWADVSGQDSATTVSLSEGLYFYICTLHPAMVGAILVEDCKDIVHEHECRCNEDHHYDGSACAKCGAPQCTKNEAAVWEGDTNPAPSSTAAAGACLTTGSQPLDCTSMAATQAACIAPYEDGGVDQATTACCKISSGATRLLGDKKTATTHCCDGGFQSASQAQCQTYLNTCAANKELVGGSADSDKTCSDCSPDKTAENGQPCETFAEKEFGNEVKPTSGDGIKGRIKGTSFGETLVQKRKQFQSIIRFLKQQIRALATKRVKMQKEDLPLSETFKTKMGARTKIDVVVPKVKTPATLNSANACDEADVDVKAQPDAYDINLAEGESGLICSGSDPITKLEMTREGSLHGEDVDLYDYACWDGSAWLTEVEVQSGADYVCDGMKFYVNSLSGITCNVSAPVTTNDASVVSGVSGADCGATIADGQSCNYTCNANFVQTSAPACSADGFVPATCECSAGHKDNLDGTCTPCPAGTFAASAGSTSCTAFSENASSCNALRKPFIAGDASTDTTCGNTCSAATHFAAGAVCVSYAETAASCNALRKKFIAGDEDTDASCGDMCANTTQYAAGANCVDYSKNASSCNALRKPFIAGDEDTDASCGNTCSAATHFAAGAVCVPYYTSAPAGYELILNGDEDTQHEQRACGLGTYKALSDASTCIVCEDGYEIMPIGTESNATGCEVCDVATEYDQDGIAHTGCIETLAHCPAGFQHIETNSTSPNICEYCPDGTFQPLNDTLDQCQPYSNNAQSCNAVRKSLEDAGASKILDDSSCASGEVCDDDHYASGFDCLPYGNTEVTCNAVRKTLLHGEANAEDDSNCSATVCSALHFADNEQCTLYNNTAQSCNAERLALAVLGSENAEDNSACAVTTCTLEEHASGFECVASLNTEASCLQGTTRVKGTDFLVSNYNSNSQRRPSLSALEGGGLVAVWASKEQDTDDWGIYARLYDNQGTALAVEFKVNTHIADEQSSPTVAALSDGGFVVVWQSNEQDSDSWGVYQQRYDAAGNTAGGEELVNTEVDEGQALPHVAAFLGGYVVVWQSEKQHNPTTEIFLKRYDNAGATVGAEEKVNTYIDGQQERPAVAALKDNGFVVLWEGQGEADTWGVFAKAYDSSGATVKDDFLVNSITNEYQEQVAVIGLDEGGFVAAWTDGNSVLARAFDKTFEARGDVFAIETSSNKQEEVSLEAIPDGGFITAWQEKNSTTYDIKARRFGKTLQAHDAFVVNDYTTSEQKRPSLAHLSNNQLFVAWDSKGQDQSAFESIYARQYTVGEGNSRVIYSTHNDADNSQCQVCLHESEIADKLECKCAEDHHASAGTCNACAEGKRLAGDSKDIASECCVEGYQSAIAAVCIDYSVDASSCNAQRQPLIEGTRSVDASCTVDCLDTQFAEGTECVPYTYGEFDNSTACNALRKPLVEGTKSSDTTCAAACLDTQFAQGLQCIPYTYGEFNNSAACNALRQPLIEGTENSDTICAAACLNTQYAQGSQCIDYNHADSAACNALRKPLVEGTSSVDASCGDACLDTHFAQGSACVPYTYGEFDNSAACNALRQPLIKGTEDSDTTCATACLNTQFAQGLECFDYINSCLVGFELDGTANDTQKTCQACQDGHYKSIDGSSACLPHTTCLASETQIGAPTTEVDRVCGCAENHYFNGLECQSCATGTRLAGDTKTDTATQCCVGGYQSAVAGECIAYSEDAQSCNPLRRPLVEGTASQDSACGALCNTATHYAQGTECVVFVSHCPAGQERLDSGRNDSDTCTTCATGLYKKEADDSKCIACGDGHEIVPINALSGGEDCVICDKATEYDHDNFAHTGCITTVDTCDKEFQIVVTNETNGNLCESCPAEHYQDIDDTIEQCKAWTVCDIGNTEVANVQPSLAVNRVCGCAQDHHVSAGTCQQCTSGTRRAGDGKDTASECCVDAYQSAVGGGCTGYTEDAQSCNALRQPLIEGTRSADASCAAACLNTQFAQGTQCVPYTYGEFDNSAACNALRQPLVEGTNDSDTTCATACLDTQFAQGTQCVPYTYSDFDNSAACNALRQPLIEGTEDSDTTCAATCLDTQFAQGLQCIPYTYGEFDNSAACNALRQPLVEGTEDSDTTCATACLDTHFAQGTQCVPYTYSDFDNSAACNALRQPLIEGTEDSDTTCAAACLDTQFAQGTECVDYINSCLVGFELDGGDNDTQKTCQACQAGHYKSIDGSSACLPHTTCLASETQIGAPTTEVDRVCGCAEDYHFNGTDCNACATGTRLAGDSKTDGATQCCLGGYQSAVAGECIAYSEDAQSCNPLRRPLVEGDEDTDAQCGALCNTATHYAQGTECVEFSAFCPAGQERLDSGRNNSDTCTPCTTGLFKKEADDSKCSACGDGHEIVPINALGGGEDCIICDKAIEYDHDKLAHTGCITTTDTCNKQFQIVVTNETTGNLCESCPEEHYQHIDDTAEQCKAWTVCDINNTEVVNVQPSRAVNRVCGCALDHHVAAGTCQQCAEGTRLAGDGKGNASECCVGAYQSAVGATCTAYTENTTSCNAERKPFVAGDASKDTTCAAACNASTHFAQGTGCVAYISSCGNGTYLSQENTPAAQKQCLPCPAGTYKDFQGAEACLPCAAGSEVNQDKDQCTACVAETHYDDDKDSSTVCAEAVANCGKGTQLVVMNRTTNNKCEACTAGQFQELDESIVQCTNYTENATYCNSLNKILVAGTSTRNSHCDNCLAGEAAVGEKCFCAENYHLVEGVCTACAADLFRPQGDDKVVDQNTNCAPSGCFVLPDHTNTKFAIGQGNCVDSIVHGQTCKLECAAGHQSYAYSCNNGVRSDPVVACSKCPKYQHSVDGVCKDDTAYLTCNCTSAACPESGDTYFSIGRHDRDDSECRQATWVEEQIGQGVERPTTDYAIKQVFQAMATVFEAPVQAGNTTETPTKEEQREHFQSIVQYVKDEIEAMPNRRVEIPKEVMVLSDEFLQGLGDRKKVELVIPKAKTSQKIDDPLSACEEKDVDLAAQEAAYDVALVEGEISLICRGDEPVTKLEKLTDGFEYACFENGAWLGTESIGHDGAYECAGKKFYINSHSGLTCPVTRPVSADNKLIVTGKNLNCGLTIAEGELCQTECNANYVKVSEANCTVEGFQAAICKCDKEGYSEDYFGNCKQCDIGSFSTGGGCQPWTIGAEDCNALRKVFQVGNATMDAQCGEVCPEGLVAERDHCTDPDKQIHCDTLSWFYFSGACCDNFDNSPTCLNQVDRKAVPVMQSLSYIKRADRTDCWEGDKVVFRDGGIVCEYEENSSVEPTT